MHVYRIFPPYRLLTPFPYILPSPTGPHPQRRPVLPFLFCIF
jgi:hypothetical protein